MLLSKPGSSTDLLNLVELSINGRCCCSDGSYHLNVQIGRLSFNDQIRLFQQTVLQVHMMLGRAAATDLLHNSLFGTAIGSNDYLNNYLLSSINSTRTQYTPSQFVQLLMSTLTTQFTVLIQQPPNSSILPPNHNDLN